MPDKASVFISYSRRDKSFAEALHAAFQRSDRTAWLDMEDIRPAAKWSGEIAEAIDGSDAIIFVLSPDFIASKECANEIHHAAQQNKRLIPVVARAVEPRDVPEALAELQWIWFLDEAEFNSAFETLSKAIDTDLAWVSDHTRYHVRAVEWEAKGRPASLVLRGKQLAQAEQWLAEGGSKNPKPSLLQSQYVAAGRQAARRRQRLVAGSLATGLVIALVLAVFAFIQRDAAREARDEAVHTLYTLQLTRTGDLINREPDGALDVLDDTLRTADGLREFTLDLFRRLSSRTLLTLGGIWNRRDKIAEEAAPILALSHDGSLLASASVRRAKRWQHSKHSLVTEILVWDTESGARLHTLTLKEGNFAKKMRVEAISFSADGQHVAASAGTYPSVVKVWELTTGNELMATEGKGIEFLALTSSGLSPEARLRTGPLIGIQHFGKIYIWDTVGPHAEMRSYKGATVGAVALGSDGSNLFTATAKEIVRWNTASGEHDTYPNPAGIQGYTALSVDAKHIAQVNFDTISIWEADSDGPGWNPKGILKDGHAERVTSIAFSPDGRTLASGGNDHTVRLWDIERGVVTLTLRGPKANVTALAFSSDGRRLAAGAADATVFVWDVAGPPKRPANSIEIEGKPSCLVYSVENAAMLVADKGKILLRTPNGVHELTTFAGAGPRQCGISENGNTAFYVNEDAHVKLWTLATEETHAQIGPVSDPRSVRLSPLGQVVAAFAGVKRVGIWNAKSGQLEGSIHTDGELMHPFAFLSDQLLVGKVRRGDQDHFTLWNVEDRKMLAAVATPMGTPPQTFALCRERLLFASAAYEKLQILDLETGRVLHDLHWYQRGLLSLLRRPVELTFSPDCATLVMGDDVGEIHSWDVATGEQRYVVSAHSGPEITKTNRRGHTGVATRRTGHGVTALAFSPDGSTIASGGGTVRGGGELRLWRADRGEQLAELPASLGAVSELQFSLNGSRLAALLKPPVDESDRLPSVLEMWSTNSSRELQLIAAHASPITRVKFSPDGTRLLTEGLKEPAKLWDVSHAKRLRSLGDWFQLNSAEWLSEEDPPGALVARSSDGRVRVQVDGRFLLLYRDDEAVPQVLKSDDKERYFHSQRVRSIHLLRDGTLLSLAADDDSGLRPEIVLWDLKTGQPLREAYEQPDLITGLVLSPDERLFITTGAVGPALDHPGLVHVWDTHEMRHIRSLIGHRARVSSAAFSPDGLRLATGDINGFVRIWDVSTLNE